MPTPTLQVPNSCASSTSQPPNPRTSLPCPRMRSRTTASTGQPCTSKSRCPPSSPLVTGAACVVGVPGTSATTGPSQPYASAAQIVATQASRARCPTVQRASRRSMALPSAWSATVCLPARRSSWSTVLGQGTLSTWETTSTLVASTSTVVSATRLRSQRSLSRCGGRCTPDPSWTLNGSASWATMTTEVSATSRAGTNRSSTLGMMTSGSCQRSTGAAPCNIQTSRWSSSLSMAMSTTQRRARS
mmetsp:Transcript_44410/g.102617  ORF Transcript_44410/g.102617 Transcript_44410/m.102617 type:complete len:245 (-) Transcript_44410:751-1485(-)